MPIEQRFILNLNLKSKLSTRGFNMAEKSGKKNRKYGRNAKKCAAYKLMNKRRTNKRKKLIRHLKEYPDDVQAKDTLLFLN